MSVPRLRRRVDEQTFAAWRAAQPGLGLPSWFDTGPDGEPESDVTHSTRGVTVPPLVGAALAVHSDPAVTVLFALRDEASGTVGCVALAGDVVSALVRRVIGGRTAWVEVSLVPLSGAVPEVLRWAPLRPHGAAAFEVQVLEAGDVTAGWLQRWTSRGSGWRLLDPAGHETPDHGDGDLTTLALDLQFALAGRLAAAGAG